jgi:L-malate glycosyltransferase
LHFLLNYEQFIFDNDFILFNFTENNFTGKETNNFMKILHVSGARGWGGNEQQIIYIVPKLNQLGVQNYVFGLDNSVLQKECLQAEIAFVGLQKKKLNKFSNFSAFAHTLKTQNPDIIHLHTSDSLTFFYFFSLFNKVKAKIIFSKKGIGESGSYLSKLKYNSRKLDSIICVSKNVQDSFGKVLNKRTKSKTVVINDCVSLDIIKNTSNLELRKLYNISANKYLVGNIANHTSAKDLQTLINVMKFFKEVFNRHDIVFVQIGEFSSKTDELKQYALESSVGDNFIFLDKIEKASSLITQFDAFLLTSQREGGPTSLLEAILMKTPVISTNVGVVSDIIVDGENGYIADVKNHYELAKKTLLLLQNTGLQKQFVDKSYEIINNFFTSDYIAEKTFREYERVLAVN